MAKTTTTHTIRALKGKRAIVAVTAYDAITASMASEAGVDLILVGDSLGNTALGYSSTVPVTVETMLHHTAACARAQPQALLVSDIPFACASRKPDALLELCVRFIQEGGAQAVKIEGGEWAAPRVAELTRAGIPVLGHIGLLPQQVLQLGGYRKFGKTEAEVTALVVDARALEQAGAFALVIEAVEADCARAVRDAVGIPVIGIGAGGDVDGQILVISDLLGLNSGHYPVFAKKYAELRQTGIDALRQYAEEVRAETFPE